VRVAIRYTPDMNSNNWRRLSGLVMGLAVALVLIMAVDHIIQATDQQDIAAPAAYPSSS
jgi:hypothetical protein